MGEDNRIAACNPATIAPLDTGAMHADSPSDWQSLYDTQQLNNNFDRWHQLWEAGKDAVGHLVDGSASAAIGDMHRFGFLLNYSASDATQATLGAREAARPKTAGDVVVERLDKHASSVLGSGTYTIARLSGKDEAAASRAQDLAAGIGALLPAVIAAKAYAGGPSAMKQGRLADGWHSGPQLESNTRLKEAEVLQRPPAKGAEPAQRPVRSASPDKVATTGSSNVYAFDPNDQAIFGKRHGNGIAFVPPEWQGSTKAAIVNEIQRNHPATDGMAGVGEKKGASAANALATSGQPPPWTMAEKLKDLDGKWHKVRKGTERQVTDVADECQQTLDELDASLNQLSPEQRNEPQLQQDVEKFRYVVNNIVTAAAQYLLGGRVYANGSTIPQSFARGNGSLQARQTRAIDALQGALGNIQDALHLQNEVQGVAIKTIMDLSRRARSAPLNDDKKMLLAAAKRLMVSVQEELQGRSFPGAGKLRMDPSGKDGVKENIDWDQCLRESPIDVAELYLAGMSMPEEIGKAALESALHRSLTGPEHIFLGERTQLEFANTTGRPLSTHEHLVDMFAWAAMRQR